MRHLLLARPLRTGVTRRLGSANRIGWWPRALRQAARRSRFGREQATLRRDSLRPPKNAHWQIKQHFGLAAEFRASTAPRGHNSHVCANATRTPVRGACAETAILRAKDEPSRPPMRPDLQLMNSFGDDMTATTVSWMSTAD